jgi:hypothetical protein
MLHAQRLFWKSNSRNALCWAFYYVNDNKEVDFKIPQIMCCIICYCSSILDLNPTTQANRRLIICNTTNGIITLRKHVNLHHCNLFFKLMKRWIVFWKKMEYNFLKRDWMCLLIPYPIFLLQKNLSRNVIYIKSNFWKIWVF